MEPILFYGVPEGCSFGAIVALEWAGRPYRLCRIEMPTGEAFKAVNRLGETPVLIDAGGRAITQSLAILHHVAAAAPQARIGAEPGTPELDRMNEMLSFLVTSFFSSFGPLWLAFEDADERQKTVLREVGARQVAKAHAHLEALLGGRDWLVGDRPTVADAYFAGVARWTDFHGVLDRKAYPGVHRLYERLQADPAVRLAHAIEAGDDLRPHVSFEQALGGLRQAA